MYWKIAKRKTNYKSDGQNKTIEENQIKINSPQKVPIQEEL